MNFSSVEFPICSEISSGEGSYHMESVLPIWNINLWTGSCMLRDFSAGYSQTDCNFNFNIKVNVIVDSWVCYIARIARSRPCAPNPSLICACVPYLSFMRACALLPSSVRAFRTNSIRRLLCVWDPVIYSEHAQFINWAIINKCSGRFGSTTHWNFFLIDGAHSNANYTF